MKIEIDVTAEIEGLGQEYPNMSLALREAAARAYHAEKSANWRQDKNPGHQDISRLEMIAIRLKMGDYFETKVFPARAAIHRIKDRNDPLTLGAFAKEMNHPTGNGRQSKSLESSVFDWLKYHGLKDMFDRECGVPKKRSYKRKK